MKQATSYWVKKIIKMYKDNNNTPMIAREISLKFSNKHKPSSIRVGCFLRVNPDYFEYLGIQKIAGVPNMEYKLKDSVFNGL